MIIYENRFSFLLNKYPGVQLFSHLILAYVNYIWFPSLYQLEVHAESICSFPIYCLAAHSSQTEHLLVCLKVREVGVRVGLWPQ